MWKSNCWRAENELDSEFFSQSDEGMQEKTALLVIPILILNRATASLCFLY